MEIRCWKGDSLNNFTAFHLQDEKGSSFRFLFGILSSGGNLDRVKGIYAFCRCRPEKITTSLYDAFVKGDYSKTVAVEPGNE